ncbi:MAG: hypothetical protein GF317_05035 [Candidatus Lokiarchaeota archaeon]|nr:hypothetical protein [Candidatus Lokiarchaeota archaeon]MBD3199170.1 hypothetical protein [Candidatus Lokiarchaeota archaeon]
MQCFRILDDGTTEECKTDGALKEILENDQCYVIVADDIRKVYLWKGLQSSVRKKFIGAKRSQEIRGQVGMHYAVVPQDQGDEEQDFINLIGGPTTDGYAKEIKGEEGASGSGGGGGHPLKDKPIFDPPRPAGGMNIAGSKGQSDNSGPLYKGDESMAAFSANQSQLNFEKIMQKLEEIKIPDGYERELIIIGNHAYSVVEKVQTFLGKKQIEKVMERVGTIPEGVFFAENYSPRILSEGGRIIAIEFLRREGEGAASGEEPGDKKKILKDQIKVQLEGK